MYNKQYQTKAQLLKALENDKKQQTKEYFKQRYLLLNRPIVCPICGLDANINLITQHFKGKKCTEMSALIPDEKYLIIKQRINNIKELLLNKELSQDEREEELKKLPKLNQPIEDVYIPQSPSY